MIVGAWALLGLLAGALLNHLADRLPQHQSLQGAPACPGCQTPYSIEQWSAVWARVRGKVKCTACGRALAGRRGLLEVAAGVVYGLLAWRYGASWILVVGTFHASVLGLIVVTDLEERRVPDMAVLPAIAVTLAYKVLFQPADLRSALAGGAIALVLFLLCNFFHMGFGDTKLAAYVGIIAGYPFVLPCLFLAIIAGGVAAGIGLLTGRLARRSYMPYAPYIALGGALALLYL